MKLLDRTLLIGAVVLTGYISCVRAEIVNSYNVNTGEMTPYYVVNHGSIITATDLSGEGKDSYVVKNHF